MNRRNTMGARIRQARLHSGFKNRSEFARRLDVTRQAVHSWESDASKPSTTTLSNIALLTGCTVDWLATGRGTNGKLVNDNPLIDLMDSLRETNRALDIASRAVRDLADHLADEREGR